MIKQGTTKEIREDPLLGYEVWRSMHKRCKNPRTNGYSHYGGRGIRVDKSWDKFSNFLSDMGPRPSVDHQLDRIDNDGDYTPENCRWVTRRENSRNKPGSNFYITYNGQTKVITDWANEIGITAQTLRWRLRRWPLERCLTEGRGKSGPKKSKRS